MATDLPPEMLASSYEWGSPWAHGLFKISGRGGDRVEPPSRTDLHFPERIKEFVVSVGQHVQLVSNVLLRQLFGFGRAGLISRSQFNIYLYILKNKKKKKKKCKTKRSNS